MHLVLQSDAHVDERGAIRDLLVADLTSVTRITTRAGAVRGNHVHRETTQWTLVIAGQMLITDGKARTVIGPGEMVHHAPGEPHAWKAVTDCDCVVFTRGPRSGTDYESDTYRLDTPILA